MTHIEYPYIEDYIELFVEIYNEMGFETTLIPTPSTRGLLLLDEGTVDADVLRLGYTAKNYSNVIVVKPELNYANLTLLCIKNVPCNKGVLTNTRITVLAPDNAISLLAEHEFKARQANTHSLPNIPDMLKANRYKYALFLLDDLMERQFKTDFQSVKIKSMAIYHVVHKKHIALIPQIEEKIRTKLPEFLRKRGMRTIL